MAGNYYLDKYGQQPQGMPLGQPDALRGAQVRQAQVSANQGEAGIPQTRAQTNEINAKLPFVATKAQGDANKSTADATAAQIAAQSAQRLNGLPPEVFAKAVAQYGAARQLDRIIPDIEEKFNAGPGATTGVLGLLDYLGLPSSEQFDKSGSQARGIVRNALGLTGGEANTAAEMNMNLGGYIPQSGNFDATNRDIFENLKGLRDNARRQAVATLGGIPDEFGNIKKPDTRQPAEQLAGARALLEQKIANLPPKFQAIARGQFDKAPGVRQLMGNPPRQTPPEWTGLGRGRASTAGAPRKAGGRTDSNW